MHAHVRLTRIRPLIVSIMVMALVLALAVPVASATPKTKLISKSSSGVQASMGAGHPALSRDGKVVAFHTGSGLVSGDKNARRDVYARNVPNRTTKPISRGHGGVWGNEVSRSPAISENGRFVSFYSQASNLIHGHVMTFSHSYRRDRQMGRTALVSRSSSGAVANGPSGSGDISADGRYVVFPSVASNLVAKDAKGVWQIYLRDMKLKKTYLISRNNAGTAGNQSSGDPDISADGRFVVYESDATNLTTKDTKGKRQVYLYDRKSKRTTLVSKNNAGKAGKGGSGDPAISRDGKVIVYESAAANLIRAGRDSNGMPDVYRYVRSTHKTSRVSLNYRGRQITGCTCIGSADPDISANGRWLVFGSDGTNVTKAGNPHDYEHVYRRDLATGKVRLVSRSTSGARGDSSSRLPRISADGRFVTFESYATNFLAHDANGHTLDVFRRGPF